MARKILKKLPVGVERFDEIRRGGFYYVDKTGLIRELLENWGKANLFTRPRRFGKSLNMNMFQCFFEIGCDKTLFEGLEISAETDLCEEYMGKYPVVSISLKDVEGKDFRTARAMFCSAVGNEALRFYDLLESPRLNEVDKSRYRKLVQISDKDDHEEFTMSETVLSGSLQLLTALLEKHYGRQTILLIDEYDVPLAKASEYGYYDDMARLMRGLFSRSLKTNRSLYFAVLTGCLRVAKESIFTGMNNLKIMSVMDVDFDEYFGFTDGEVREMLDYYGQNDAYDRIREWYDGYHFGNVDVYCPWDVICYCDKRRSNPNLFPQSYWLNTSGNEVIQHFISRMGNGVTKTEMERLIAGESVQKPVSLELTYKELYESADHLWSVLFTAGYLTQRGRADGDVLNLAIPNLEIRKIFAEQILKLFRDEISRDRASVDAFCRAVEDGDGREVERQFTAFMERTISIRDTFARKQLRENFYHGVLLGIFGCRDGWTVLSNRESGEGFYDIQIQIDDSNLGIILEVKYADNGDMETEAAGALRQIRNMGYTEELRRSGIRRILKYGIACFRKKCRVKVEKEL